MQSSIFSFKLLLIGCFIFTVNYTVNAVQNNSIENKNSSSSIHIIEKKTGISPKRNSVLASLYKEAVHWLHTPYKYGGTSHNGIDCSAFTGAVYKDVLGIQLDRCSRDIAHKVTNVDMDNLKPGDLVFFATSRRKKGVNHIGIYLGNNQFVHASTHKGVTISSLNEGYYKRSWVKGGRVNNENEALEGLYDESFQKSFKRFHLIRPKTILITDIECDSKTNTILASDQNSEPLIGNLL